MGEQENRRDEKFRTVGVGVGDVLVGLFWLTLITGLVWLTVYIWRLPPTTTRQPDYMVSITGVDGLNLKTTSSGVPTTLSPVFNLTVRIRPSYGYWESACIRGLSTAVVSYGDAFLGKGSVPPFCAEGEEVQERVATAWGDDVVLPRFLRERLSAELERGEASLDVQVTGCSRCSDNEVLVCRKVKIGGGSSTCRMERVYLQPAPAGGSTSSN